MRRLVLIAVVLAAVSAFAESPKYVFLFIGDGLDPRAVGTHPEHAVVRLLTAGDRRRGRSGIRHDLVRALRRRFRPPRKMIHRELSATGASGEVLGHQALGRGHSVPDEQKHVLRRRGLKRNSRQRGTTRN